jgi:hypothetical protein
MIFWINCCNIAILLWLDPVRRKACLLSYEKHKYGCQRSLWRWQVHVGHHNYEVLWQLLCLTQFTWHNNINNLVSLIIKTKLRLSEWSWALPLPALPLAHGMAARRDADDVMARRPARGSRQPRRSRAHGAAPPRHLFRVGAWASCHVVEPDHFVGSWVCLRFSVLCLCVPRKIQTS